MRRLWKSLALSLGVMVTGARGQEAPAPSAPAATLGRPVASIGRPVVLPQQPAALPVIDPNLQPIAFDGASGTIVRGAAPDPSGRAPGNVNSTMFAWRAPADETAPQPQLVAPTPASPLNTGPISSDRVVGGPISSDRVVGGPVISEGAPASADCGGCDAGSCGKCCGLFGCGNWLGLGSGRMWSLFNHGQGGCPSCGVTDGGLCCDNCYPNDRFYASAEALLWWTKGSPTPPLVTMGTAAQGFVSQGALIPGTTVLFGGNDAADGRRNGGKFTAGYWFTDDHLIGIEGSYFFLGDKNGSFAAGSNGSLQIARPVNLLGTPGRELVSGTQLTNGVLSTLSGTVGVGTSSQLWGAEANLRTNLSCGPNYFLDAIAGFRTLGLDENLSVTESLLVTSTVPVIPGAAGTTFMINDSFSTKNRFYGGQIGAVGEWRFADKWSLGMDAKIGLGETQQTVDINGSTTTAPGGMVPGGLLTRAGAGGNIGHFTRDQFSVVPEIGLTLGYQLTQHVRLFAGYNFLYWTNVARPGNQIDTTVDPTQAFGQVNPNGANRPTFAFHNSDFWAQGVNLGLEFRW